MHYSSRFSFLLGSVITREFMVLGHISRSRKKKTAKHSKTMHEKYATNCAREASDNKIIKKSVFLSSWQFYDCKYVVSCLFCAFERAPRHRKCRKSSLNNRRTSRDDRKLKTRHKVEGKKNFHIILRTLLWQT